MSVPKHQDSQKNIHCLTQFLDLQRGCQDFHSLKASEKADGRKRLTSGEAEIPSQFSDHGNHREIILLPHQSA